MAPEALSRFYLEPRRGRGATEDRVGASWMTREFREREIEDYVRYLDGVVDEMEGRDASARGSGESSSAGSSGATRVAKELGPRRTLLGFSQGAHTAARWAVLGSVPFSRLVLWGAPLPDDLPEGASDRLDGMEIVLVRGERDELRHTESEERDEAWLREHDLRFRVLTHPGGHAVTATVLEELTAD